MGDSGKRGALRVSYHCEVECYGTATSPLSPRISDLSVTGAFIDSMTELPVGARVNLKFTLPTGAIAVAAEVVHSMPHFGMGVRFLDLSEEQRAAIERIVHEPTT